MNTSAFRLAIAACLLATAFASAACSSSSSATEGDDTSELTAADNEVQNTFVQANDALDAGQWSRAARLYAQVIDADPDRWDAHMNQGIALMRDHEFADATESFEMALRHGGDAEPTVYFNLGNLYQERGLYEKAIDAYRNSMAVAGGLDYETLLNISACFTFLNAHDEARQTVDRAFELDPDDPRAYLTLGILKHSDNRLDEALEIFDQVTSTHPDLGGAHYNRGFILMRMEENEEAIAAFETYLDVEPEGPYVTQSESHIQTIQNRLDR